MRAYARPGMTSFVVPRADEQLADRVRSGDVVADLHRPRHLQRAMFAEDLGRAGYAAPVRLAPPIAFGAVLAVTVSSGTRFLLGTSTFRLLDNRGPQSLYLVLSWLLCGLAVPLAFLPDWARAILWSTPSRSAASCKVVVQVAGRVYAKLVAARLRGRMAHRASFVLQCVAQAVGQLTELVVILVLFSRVTTLGGFSVHKVVLVHAVAGTAFGLAAGRSD